MLGVYNTFVLPHINYCNIVWGAAYPSSLNKLCITQKKALKVALKLPRNTPSSTVFTETKVLTIGGINRVQTCTIMCKEHSNLLPNSYRVNLKPINELHQYLLGQLLCTIFLS